MFGQGGLTFDPETVTAEVGDELDFRFFPSNHSVASGDFTNACHPSPQSSQAFCSGFIAVNKGEAVRPP